MNRQFAVVLALGTVVAVAAVTGAVTLDGTATAPTEQTADGTEILSENETLTLRAAEGQVVRGRTDVAPGETLTVRLQSVPNASTPFIRTTTATVADNGTFAATVDLSTLGDQPSFVATVRHDDEEVTNTTGRVVGTPTADSGAGVSDSSGQSAAGTRFLVEGDRLTVPATASAAVDAETDLDPGTEVAVRLRSTDGATPFLYSQPATVTDEGTLTATFDLSDVESGTEIEASVYHDDETLVHQSAVVTAG